MSTSRPRSSSVKVRGTSGAVGGYWRCLLPPGYMSEYRIQQMCLLSARDEWGNGPDQVRQRMSWTRSSETSKCRAQGKRQWPRKRNVSGTFCGCRPLTVTAKLRPAATRRPGRPAASSQALQQADHRHELKVGEAGRRGRDDAIRARGRRRCLSGGLQDDQLGLLTRPGLGQGGE